MSAKGFDLLNKVDPLANIRNGLRGIAKDRVDFSGIPVPVWGTPLVIEKTYPYAELNGVFFGIEGEPEKERAYGGRVIKIEELSRFVLAAPKEWNARGDWRNASRIMFDAAPDFHLAMPIPVSLGDDGQPWSNPSESCEFIGWAVGWLAENGNENVSPTKLEKCSFAWHVGEAYADFDHNYGDTLAEAYFRKVLKVLESRKEG